MFYYRILAALLLGAGAGMGLWRHLSRQQKQAGRYQEVLLFMTRMRNAVASLVTLPEAIQYAAQGTAMEEVAAKICKNINQSPSADLKPMWEAMWEPVAMATEERKRIQSLLSAMDMKDLSIQLTILDRYIQNLEKLTAEEEEAWRKQKGVYVKLSTMMGLLIMIVFL